MYRVSVCCCCCTKTAASTMLPNFMLRSQTALCSFAGRILRDIFLPVKVTISDPTRSGTKRETILDCVRVPQTYRCGGVRVRRALEHVEMMELYLGRKAQESVEVDFWAADKTRSCIQPTVARRRCSILMCVICNFAAAAFPSLAISDPTSRSHFSPTQKFKWLVPCRSTRA